MKMMIFCAGLCATSMSFADERITTEIYDANRVYKVRAAVGFGTLLQLEEGETLQGSSSVLGLGDAAAWKNLRARGSSVLMKPSAKQPQTNLLMVTDRRTYVIELSLAKKGEPVTWVLRFRYPDTEAAQAAAKEAARIAAAQAARARAEGESAALAIASAKRAADLLKIRVNTDYFWRGSAIALVPTAAWDDGRFTRFEYNHGGAVPVFFKVMPDGSEALINSNMDADKKTIVLHEVAPLIRARLGDAVIEVRNGGYVAANTNTTGTSVPGLERVNKGF